MQKIIEEEFAKRIASIPNQHGAHDQLRTLQSKILKRLNERRFILIKIDEVVGSASRLLSSLKR